MYTYIFIYIHEESKGEIGKKHVKGKIRTERIWILTLYILKHTFKHTYSLHTQTVQLENEMLHGCNSIICYQVKQGGYEANYTGLFSHLRANTKQGLPWLSQWLRIHLAMQGLQV